MLLLAYKQAKILIEVINMTNDEKMLQMLEALTGEVKSFNTRLDNMDTRFDKIEARLDKIETRLDNMEARLDNMQHDIKSGFDMLGSFVNEIEKATTETEKRFNRLKQAI
jgi:septal ring factor EnvC (AmiA/AmiB activator)